MAGNKVANPRPAGKATGIVAPQSFADREAGEIAEAADLVARLDTLIGDLAAAIRNAGSVKGAHALIRARQRVISNQQIADHAAAK
jgi:hypothetical protein